MSGFFTKITGFIGATNGENDVPEAVNLPSTDDNASDSSFDMVALESSSEESDFENVNEEEQADSDSSHSFVEFGSENGRNGESDASDIDHKEYSALNSSSEVPDFESVKREDDSESNDSSIDFGSVSDGKRESDIDQSEFSFADDSEHESEYSYIYSDDSDSDQPSTIKPVKPEFALGDSEDILFSPSPFLRMESSASYHRHLNQQYGPIEYPTDSEESSFDDGADLLDETESDSDVPMEEIERVVVNILEEKMGTAMASVFSKIQAATEKLNSNETKYVEKNEELSDESFSEAFSAALMNPMEVEEKVEEEEAEKIPNPEAPREYTGQELIKMFEEEMNPESQSFVVQLLEELQNACSGEEDPKKRHMKIRRVIDQNMRDYVKDLMQRINKLAGRKVYCL